MQREGGCAVVRQGHLIAVVGAFLIGCAVLLLVIGGSGVRAEASQEEKQGHNEATKEQGRSPEATTSEEPRCEGTRTIKWDELTAVTNDVPGCPNGGLLSGTDGPEILFGKDGDDKMRGLGGYDTVTGGSGSDVIYGGPGTDGLKGSEGNDVLYGGPDDDQLWGGGGADVIYGGDGNDYIVAAWPACRHCGGPLGDGQHDKLYCGAGRDHYYADKLDYVSSSCEVKYRPVIPS